MKAPSLTRIVLFIHGAICAVGLLLALPHVFTFGEAFFRYRPLNLDSILLIEKCLATAHTVLSVNNSVADILGVYFARFVVAAPFMMAAFAIARSSRLVLRWLLARTAPAPKPHEGMIAAH